MAMENGDVHDRFVMCPVLMGSYNLDEWLRPAGTDQVPGQEKQLDDWCQYMNKARNDWDFSYSLWSISDHVRVLAERLSNVDTIVCFELGTIACHGVYTAGALHHCFVFTITRAINEVHDTKGQSKVRVVLQDLFYYMEDKIVLVEQYTEGIVEFVDDPDGLLAISENSLVLALNLSLDFPLLQTCTDLPHPAAFIVEPLEVDPNKAIYTWCERGSPRVARMLSWQYAQLHTLEKSVPPNIGDAVFSEDERFTWLKAMCIRIRRAGQPECDLPNQMDDGGEYPGRIDSAKTM
ncbi:hypothetical protein CC86DRAFT_407250 [Ophiobolus disseminans]|uniref:SRR1-like domain-containing protein n=1 Tax=Ophiobolus disseminans TaxID=1469910 RepID=A0A6A6ZYR6_9PLEO|nr:hypothetical protein CC86DRAFT_407250 [Ophiobolus disseminans]